MLSCEKKIILQSGLTFLHMFYSFTKAFLFVFTMLVALYVSKLWMGILMDRWSNIKGPFGIEGEYRFVYESIYVYMWATSTPSAIFSRACSCRTPDGEYQTVVN